MPAAGLEIREMGLQTCCSLESEVKQGSRLRVTDSWLVMIQIDPGHCSYLRSQRGVVRSTLPRCFHAGGGRSN